MPILTVSDDQVIELVKQLPPDQQERLFEFLLTQQWGAWVDLSRYGEERARIAAAQRGHAWDAMTESEREAFIDDLVHEDRSCAG
jgi:hypothetical protein